jgi:hypothetical protein
MNFVALILCVLAAASMASDNSSANSKPELPVSSLAQTTSKLFLHQFGLDMSKIDGIINVSRNTQNYSVVIAVCIEKLS